MDWYTDMYITQTIIKGQDHSYVKSGMKGLIWDEAKKMSSMELKYPNSFPSENIF